MGVDSGSRRRAPVATDSADPSPVLLGRDGRSPYLRLVGRGRLLPPHHGFIHPHRLSLSRWGRTIARRSLWRSCLVAAQAEHLLQPQRTPSGFLAGHVPHRLKPHSQGLLRPFKNRTVREVRRRHFLHFRWPVLVSQASKHIADIGSSAATEPAGNARAAASDENQSLNSCRVLG